MNIATATAANANIPAELVSDLIAEVQAELFQRIGHPGFSPKWHQMILTAAHRAAEQGEGLLIDSHVAGFLMAVLTANNASREALGVPTTHLNSLKVSLMIIRTTV